MARTYRIQVLLGDSEHNLLLQYMKDNGYDSKAAAARDMIRRQGRYSKWLASSRGRFTSDLQELRRLGEATLRAHPGISEAQLGYHLMRHKGRFVDAKAVEKAARELIGSD